MVIPTIGFFMPLPLAMMIPFMGIQSAVMAKQFGENFQYGKRRISAMSNEEFNKLTPAILQANANAELKAMIPTMEASIKDMRDFQAFIVKEFMEMLNDLISRGLGNIFGDDIVTSVEHFLHGHGGAPPGHEPDYKSGTLPPPPDAEHVHTPGMHGHPAHVHTKDHHPEGEPEPPGGVPDSEVRTDIEFNAKNPAKINSTKPFFYSGNKFYHNITHQEIVENIRVLEITFSPHYWPLKAWKDVKGKHLIEFHKLYGHPPTKATS